MLEIDGLKCHISDGHVQGNMFEMFKRKIFFWSGTFVSHCVFLCFFPQFDAAPSAENGFCHCPNSGRPSAQKHVILEALLEDAKVLLIYRTLRTLVFERDWYRSSCRNGRDIGILHQVRFQYLYPTLLCSQSIYISTIDINIKWILKKRNRGYP